MSRNQAPGRATLPRMYPSPEEGLTEPQARDRLEGGWGNPPVESPTKSEGQIITENLFTFFNLIFVVLAVCLALVGSFGNMLFLGVAALNTLIGIVQEIRSKRTIDKLNLLSAPHTNVVRDSRVTQVKTADLVRDDVAVFAAGNQICADGEVLSGEAQVNEALITGEADPVAKRPGDKLLSGSFVVAGTCRARLDQVGADSYASRLTLEAKKEAGSRPSEMMTSLRKLIRVIGTILLPVGLVLFFKQHYFLGLPLQDAVESTVGALIGMIPEGLYLLTSVALALGVLRLAQRRTLVQEMSCIETLARVDVLCADKTGTITEPGFQVRGVVPLDSAHWPEETLKTALAAFFAASDPDNDTARAMAEAFPNAGDWEAVKTVPFLSSTKWSAVVFRAQGAFVVGAPSFVLGEGYTAVQPQAEAYARQGERILVLAKYEGFFDGPGLAGPVTPLALVRLGHRIRAAAPETFRYFSDQGVEVKVISGDDPLTVSRVAAEAGIAGADRWADASALTDGELRASAERYSVFGRVSPSQKRVLVNALRDGGHTVAMTGDGVNDVLALKDSDCGIAMASGSEAACQAAQLVLLDSDFSALPQVVLEGRRVINNIQRASSLFLVKNIFSFFLALVTLFVSMPYPIIPLQLTLVGTLTIGIPSFFLALEPNESLVRGKFITNVLSSAFPGGMAVFLAILGAEVCAWLLGLSQEDLSTMSALLLAVNGLMVLWQVCKPFDAKRRVLWAALAAVMGLVIFFFGPLFSLTRLGVKAAAALAGLLLCLYPLSRAALWSLRKGGAAWRDMKAKRT